MFKVRRGLRHTLTLLRALPRPAQRRLVRQMVAFSRVLPAQFESPLPLMMERLTPPPQATPSLSPDTVRQLADAVAVWHVRSPLGICLRRALLRYHFLNQAGLPVQIVFGARFKEQAEGGGIGGHAWLTLADRPYYENPQDYDGFVVMYTYPPAGTKSPSASSAFRGGQATNLSEPTTTRPPPNLPRPGGEATIDR